MRRKLSALLSVGVILALSAVVPGRRAAAENPSSPALSPTIPKTWDDAAMATLEVPPADPVGSPKRVSSDYYYKIPVRPIYKEYPIYAPGHGPAGYMEWLKGQEPEILWDDRGHAPPLHTEADWIRAGELVFEASPQTGGVMSVERATSPDWWAKIGAQTGKDGALPGYHHLISEKGKVGLGDLSCASCHTRVMPDGTVVKGAPGNFPFDHNRALELRSAAADDPTRKFAGPVELCLFGVPWLKDVWIEPQEESSRTRFVLPVGGAAR